MTEPLTTAHNCHRVAVAVDDLDAALEVWARVFGAGTMLSPRNDEIDGSRMGMVWLANMPLLALSSTDPEGNVGRYLRRNGPSVQSLAWEIEDMWGTDHRLRNAGYTITGVHVPGRHFFVHPRDTFGLLIEFTDDVLAHDPRHGAAAPAASPGIIDPAGIARVTAAVPDLDPVREQIGAMFGVPTTEIDTADGEPGFDVTLGDIVLRVVRPDRSGRFGDLTEAGSGRFASITLAVRDFGTIEAAIDEAGLSISDRDQDSVWIDPAGTQGIRFELIAG